MKLSCFVLTAKYYRLGKLASMTRRIRAGIQSNQSATTDGRIHSIDTASEGRMIPEMDALVERVRRLEQQNRAIKWIAAGILLLVIVTGLAAQQRPVRTIEAEKFVLLDSKGRARVTIGTPRSSGVAIDLPADEPSIWISDVNGTDRVIITTDGLRLANESSKPAASLTFTNKKGAEILLHNADGKLLYRAP
jgi:hypothetical protein